ncbi:MAG TPA: TonB-dependent receptor [Thermoanaerobaculaceae bacterium]|nr:TonB-dependent receptor [Thermoanaerobaculaceae bacterium]
MRESALKPFAVVAVVAAILLTGTPAPAQGPPGTGVITGRVLFEDTGEPLSGVEVRLVGTTISTTTDRTGRYRLTGVAAGEQTVVVTAQGFTTKTGKVTVAGGSTVTYDTRLAVFFAEAVEVTAPLLKGEARALTVQKNAPNIINVVSADQVTELPDPNVAEAASRVPGISLTLDDGEGENIVVRGLPPQLNSVTINGERIPSTDQFNRNIDFVNMSSAIIQSIEVSKAIRPDQDGDAIGGVVNLVTKQAPEDPVLSVSLGEEYVALRPDYNTRAGFTFGRRFGEGKYGFVASGSYEQHDRGNETRGDITWDGPTLNEHTLRGEGGVSDRYTINLALDRMSESASFFVRGTTNERDQTKIRRRKRLRDIDLGIDGANGGRIDWDIRDRYREVATSGASLGGTVMLGPLWGLDYGASWGLGRQDEPNTVQTIFRQKKVGFTTPIVSGYDVYVFPTNENPGKAALNEVQVHSLRADDEDVVGHVDLTAPISGGTYGTLKFGVKYRAKDKTSNEDETDYAGNGPTLAEVMEPTTYHIYDDKYGVLGQFPPSRLGLSLIDQYHLEGTIDHDLDTNDYTAHEDVTAGYVQAELNFTPRLSLLAGARYERTSSNYTGNEVIYNTDGDYQETRPIKGKSSYGNFLPGAHLRYSFNDRTNLRFSVTAALARPDFIDLIPYVRADLENEEIQRGNPDLRVTTATNLDLMFEHYFSGVGAFTAGVFYKDIKNPIVTRGFNEEIDGERFLVTQPENGESSSIVGAEVAYSKQFRSLPPPWDGLGVVFNYTYAHGDLTLGDGRKVPFYLQSEHSGNFALSYEKGGFSGRVAFRYASSYLLTIEDSDENDIYVDNHAQWDLDITQRLSKHFSLYLEVLNLNDEPFRNYYGGEFRPQWFEHYSRWGTLGVRYSLY